MLGAPVPILNGRRHRGGIESVAVPLPAGVEWRSGVQITPVCGIEPFVWGCESASAAPPDDVKPITSVPASVQFDSTLVGVGVECSGAPGALGPLDDQLAREGWARTAWQRLAQVVHDGEVGAAAANPSFQSVAEVPTGWLPGSPACIIPSLQGVLDKAGECWNGDLVIHIPFDYLPYFLANHLVKWYADDQVYRMGSLVVSFDFYPNLGPSSLGAGAIPAADGSEVWIYVSGPIYYGIATPDEITARKHLRNESTTIYEAGAVVAFEPCCVAAVKAEVC